MDVDWTLIAGKIRRHFDRAFDGLLPMKQNSPNSTPEEQAENDHQAPPEFGPLFRTSPLLDLLGTFFGKGSGADLVIGLRAARKHTNSRGTVHGGVLAAMADVSLGYVTAFGSDPPKRLVTASLSIDYTGSARVGDWIEARVDWSRPGRTLAFANCYITVGENQIARASAVFSVVRE
jgi:acyl-coenzyme A thioesterase 13